MQNGKITIFFLRCETERHFLKDGVMTVSDIPTVTS